MLETEEEIIINNPVNQSLFLPLRDLQHLIRNRVSNDALIFKVEIGLSKSVFVF